MIIIVCIIFILILLVVWYISVSNKFNRLLIKIDEANSGIDIALTKRYDVLTKMIDVVKGYAKHEKETLFKVINMRKNMSISEKNEENQKMDYNFEQIKLLVENYPDLKASENYITLQNAISEVEEHLQASRRLYNSNVSIFNQMLVVFPSSLVASAKGLTAQEFFKADEAKTKDVKINL